MVIDSLIEKKGKAGRKLFIGQLKK
jgi:hypothetical protein